MHIPRSPRGEVPYDANPPIPKPSLRTPGSLPPHKDLKVRFAEVDQLKEAEANRSAMPGTATPNAQPGPQALPYNGAYWIPGGDPQHPPGSQPQAPPAPAAYPPNGQGTTPQVGQHFQAPYGYYFNPYAYAQYAANTGPAQAWPPQNGSQLAGSAPQGFDGAMPAVPSPVPPNTGQQDPTRMQLMARSVSITVNPAQVENGPVGAPQQPAMVHAAGPALVPPSTQTSKFSSKEKTEEHEEERLLIWASRRLHWSCLLRIFRAWSRLRDDRWWKTQLYLRDQQAQLLAAQVRHLESRPVRYIRRYKIKHIFRAWVAFCANRRRKRASLQHATAHATISLLIRVIQVWALAVREYKQEAATERRATLLHEKRQRRSLFVAWRHLSGRRARKEARIHGAELKRAHRLLRLSLGSWAYLARLYKTERGAIKARGESLKALFFTSWQHRTALRTHYAHLVENARARHAASLHNWAFLVWVGYIEGKRARTAHEFQAQLNLEVERLRQENERLARVVDSGDWNRDRVAELTQAGQVLQQERDALLKLVESLPGAKLAARRGSRLSTMQPNNGTVAGGTAVGGSTSRRPSVVQPPWDSTGAKVPTQIGEIGTRSRVGSILAAQSSAQPLDDLPLLSAEPPKGASTAHPQGGAASAGPTPNPIPARIPANTSAKMAVRAGSSFNSLVRALKQDLLTSGALARDPGAAVAVDKLSTHHVELTTEGGLKIEAVRNTASPGFSFSKSGAKIPIPPKYQKSSDGFRGTPGVFGGRSVAFGKRLNDEAEVETELCLPAS